MTRRVRSAHLQPSPYSAYFWHTNLEPSGEHFNLRPGHNVSDIRGIVLEEVTSDDPYILKAREHHYISLFDTYNKGLNRQR